MCEHTHDCECVPAEQVEEIVDDRVGDRVVDLREKVHELADRIDANEARIDRLEEHTERLSRENAELRKILHAVSNQLPDDSPAKARIQEVL